MLLNKWGCEDLNSGCYHFEISLTRSWGLPQGRVIPSYTTAPARIWVISFLFKYFNNCWLLLYFSIVFSLGFFTLMRSLSLTFLIIVSSAIFLVLLITSFGISAFKSSFN